MERQTVNQIYHFWREDKKRFVRQSTIALYTYVAERHILPYFGTLTDIDESAVQQFVLDKAEEGLGEKSVRLMLMLLRMIMRFGHKKGWAPAVRWDVHIPQSMPSGSLQILSMADHRHFLSYLDEHFSFRNLGIYICLCTGMRIGEICGLKWGDIDLKEGLIRVRRTVNRIYSPAPGRRTAIVVGAPKTRNSLRDIPVNHALLKKLRLVTRLVQADDYVVSNSSSPLEPRMYRAYFKSLAREAGLPSLRFHALRHSFATRCIESKCDYKAVSTILGHSSITTTLNLYVHPNIDEKRKCVDVMFKRVSGA